MTSYQQTIALNDARFYAYHGLYPEEQILGNEFFLNISCTLDPASKFDDDIAQTVNYETLYGIAREEMAIPRKLLETVVESILNRIKAKFHELNTATVTLTKQILPGGSDRVSGSVTLTWRSDKIPTKDWQ